MYSVSSGPHSVSTCKPGPADGKVFIFRTHDFVTAREPWRKKRMEPNRVFDDDEEEEEEEDVGDDSREVLTDDDTFDDDVDDIMTTD